MYDVWKKSDFLFKSYPLTLVNVYNKYVCLIVHTVIYLFIYFLVLISSLFSLFPSRQKFPNEGLANVVRNVFDFDSYNKDARDVLIEALHKHGIPIGAKPTSVNLAKE